MKFLTVAFIVMGRDYNPTEQLVSFENEFNKSYLVGVNNMEQACEAAKDMVGKGVDMIELCGYFKAEGTEKIVEYIDGAVPVGYVTFSESEAKKLASVFK